MSKGRHKAPRRAFRRLSLLAALAMVAGTLAVTGGVASGHTSGDPFVTDLIAAGGSDASAIDAGDVLVWNNRDTLYVKYVTDGWCLTATHLAVAASPGDLPQTKKGNPIPGQFEYSMTHDCVTEYTYEIPLTWDPESNVYIAAHSVVKSAIGDCYEAVWQIGDVEYPVEYPIGTPNAGQTLLTNYADEFGWPNATPYTAGDSLAVVEPAFADPFVVGTTPVAQFPYNSNYVRGYATDFDVQWDGHLHFGGLLTISWSPGQSAAETKVITEDGTSTSLSRTGTPAPGLGYFLDRYPVFEEAPITVGPYGTGTHTIRFQHTQGDGTFWDWLALERPCERYETGWGDGTDFPGKNWATYITYKVQKSFDAVAAGTGLRNRDGGDIVISGIPADATVELAMLVWAILYETDVPPGTISLDGTLLNGTQEGISGRLCWFDANTVGYSADVTSIVAAKGNGTYRVSGAINGVYNLTNDPNGELPYTDGASLFVIYSGGGANGQYLADWSYETNTAASGLISRSFTGISSVGGPAKLLIAGPDGQIPAGERLDLTGSGLLQFFNTWNGSDPIDGASPLIWDGASGNLWDTDVFDVSSILPAGQTTLDLEAGFGTDCIGLSGAVLVVEQ